MFNNFNLKYAKCNNFILKKYAKFKNFICKKYAKFDTTHTRRELIRVHEAYQTLR